MWVCLVTERAFCDMSASSWFEPCFEGIWDYDPPGVVRTDKPSLGNAR